MKTLVVPALSWLVEPGVVGLTAYGVFSGGVVGVVALCFQWSSESLICSMV